MKKHMNFINNYDNSQIFTNNEFKQRKRELVEKHITMENLKTIPELYDILVEDYRNNFIKKMEYKIEYLYKTFQDRFKFYGILEKEDADFLYIDLLHIIFKNLSMKLDLEIILENENYVNMVFDEFQLKYEL
jgi:hypothetical protein